LSLTIRLDRVAPDLVLRHYSTPLALTQVAKRRPPGQSHL